MSRVSDPARVDVVLSMKKEKLLRRKGRVVARVRDEGIFGYVLVSDASAVRDGLIADFHGSASSMVRVRMHVRDAMAKAAEAAEAKETVR